MQGDKGSIPDSGWAHVLCDTTTEPVLQSLGATTREAAAMKAGTPQLESSPNLPQLGKRPCSNEDPAQPKLNK